MEAAAVAAARGGTVRFVALDRQHAPIERELKAAFARRLGSSAVTLGVEVDRFEAEYLRPDEIERVAEAVHAAVRTPNARSGENRC
jgi:hypothetical protein